MASNSIITPGVEYTYGNSVKGDCVEVWLENIPRPGVTNTSDAPPVGYSNALIGLVAQNVQGSIQKQPRQFYEVGTTNYYFVEARPSGSGSIDHLVGPNTTDIWASIRGFASVCNETNLYMGKKIDCKLCKPVKTLGTVCFREGLLNAVQVTATANDWVLTSRLGFSFYDLTDDSVEQAQS